MAKVLFFFTSSYPFGKGETFIENEIEYLAKAFDKIIIVSNDIANDQTREVPKNIELKRKGYELSGKEKLSSLQKVLHQTFWEELKIINRTYKIKLTYKVINTMLQTLKKGELWQKYIDILINNYTQNDEVYLYSYWNNDIAFALANYKRVNSEVKAFCRMHGWDVFFEVNEINYLPYRKYIFNHLDKVYAISNRAKAYYNNLLGIEGKIGVSNLGVPYKGENSKTDLSKLEILTISNTIAIKNLEVFVHALKLLGIDFHWTHIGDGDLQESIYKIASNLIPGKFTFTGRIANLEVISYLQNNCVDVFVNISLSEGVPVSIMEAMSFGIPVIATNVGGTSEIVNGENGILIEEKPSPQKVADNIHFFNDLTNEEKRNLRRAAFKTWREKYNAEKNYTSFIKDFILL